MSCSFVVISPLFFVLPELLFPSDLLESNWMTSHSVFMLQSNIKVLFTNSSLQPCLYLGYVWPWSRVYFGGCSSSHLSMMQGVIPTWNTTALYAQYQPQLPWPWALRWLPQVLLQERYNSEVKRYDPYCSLVLHDFDETIFILSSSVRCINFWCVWTSFWVTQCHSTPNCGSSARWWVFHACGWASDSVFIESTQPVVPIGYVAHAIPVTAASMKPTSA